jgi:Ca2+-binding RTX toxin-like protein
MRHAFRGEAHGNEGNDVIHFSGDCIGAVGYGESGNDQLTAISNNYGVTFYGGSGDDLLRGSDEHDYLHGGDGIDTLLATSGNDEVVDCEA